MRRPAFRFLLLTAIAAVSTPVLALALGMPRGVPKQ